MHELKRALFAFLLIAFLGNTVFAYTVDPEDPTSQLLAAMSSLCEGLRTLVPVAAMLMVLFASVIYATGQMMGAETRARANVWATSALTGALVGILIATVAPAVLQVILGNQGDIQC